jgi:hypothetical protein
MLVLRYFLATYSAATTAIVIVRTITMGRTPTITWTAPVTVRNCTPALFAMSYCLLGTWLGGSPRTFGNIANTLTNEQTPAPATRTFHGKPRMRKIAIGAPIAAMSTTTDRSRFILASAPAPS